MSNEFELTFSTDLNETLSMTVFARTYESAIRKIKKEFPSAFNFR
jgi:hypothetical protein